MRFLTRLMLLAKSYSEYRVWSVRRKPELLLFCIIKIIGMKQHNHIVQFKNSFLADPTRKERLTSILNEDPAKELQSKLQAVGKVYHSQVAQNGYSAVLAYRVIMLHLMAPPYEGLDLKVEIERFFRHCLAKEGFEGLKMSFDLLLVKQTNRVLSGEMVRLLKVRVLRGLRDHYGSIGEGRQKRKCAYTLQVYCKDSLQRDQVKRSPEIYSQILDLLIEQTKRSVSANIPKRRIVAAEQLSSFAQLLEKSQLIVTRKYQCELMEAYWALAQLHEQMHYLAFTRKYADIALNIAQRAEMHTHANQIKDLIDRLT